MNGFKVSVVALRQRRCRAGLCFGKDASEVEVNAGQLKALQADEYLRVEVLSSGETQTQTDEKPKAMDGEPLNERELDDERSDDERSDDERSGGEVTYSERVAWLATILRDNGYDGSGKKPTVRECEKLCGDDIDAQLRDAAWDSLTTEAKQ